ncbi:MAG: hypothetical protein ACYS8S_08420 [Planctomycetota bacterium]
MRILNSQEVHFQPTDMRFGPSKVKAVVVFLIFVGVFTIPLVETFKDRQWGAFALVSFIYTIFLLVFGSLVVNAFKKDGWKVAIQNSAILLKADITGKGDLDILEIQFREVASLRKLREQYVVYKRSKKRTYLRQVRLDSLDILGTLAGAGTVGFEMTASDRLIYPAGVFMLNTRKIIGQLETYCRVQEEQSVKYDKPDLKDAQQVNDYILFLHSDLGSKSRKIMSQNSYKILPQQNE